VVPDSRWVAFARPEEKIMTTIYLYSLETKQTTAVTDGWFSSTAPSFSTDGKYLFFVSQRTLSPIYSQTEWNHAYQDMAKIYFVTLARDTKSPFAPKSDEVKMGPAEEKPKDERRRTKASSPSRSTSMAFKPASPFCRSTPPTTGTSSL